MKLNRLKRRLAGDHNFKGHTIIGSMCSEPHPIAKRTYKKFLSTNVGDPGLFPNLKELEKEYIRELGTLLSNPSADGMVVTGGSEANILAMWTARTIAGNNQREVIIPETCHFSFEKAANILELKLVKIPVDLNHRVRVDLVEKAVNEKTMAIVGIAGTTGTGSCDPIELLSEIAVRYGIYLHIDAAFGGFVFPFLDNPPAFDFSLKGVSSITMDPHKMGRAVIQSGCIIFRNKSLSEAIQIPVSYLSGGKAVHNSILGTRSGASIASSWMVYNYLGIEGYKKVVDRAIKLTGWFSDEVEKIDGLGLIVKPEINIVGICTTGNIEIKYILEKVREKGWAVSEWADYIRITIMPHVTKGTLKKFLRDIKRILKSINEK